METKENERIGETGMVKKKTTKKNLMGEINHNLFISPKGEQSALRLTSRDEIKGPVWKT